MRLTIFWRVILAHSILLTLTVGVSLYAYTHLHALAGLSTEIVHTDAASLSAEKKVQKLFVAQMRTAEKYRLWRDKAFYAHFTQGSSDLSAALDAVAALVTSPQEQDLVAAIRAAYTRYANALATSLAPNSSWEREKTALSDAILTALNELMALRSDVLLGKTTLARDHALQASHVLAGLSAGGFSLAFFLAFVQARRLSRPLTALRQALLRIGQGEFQASLALRGPREMRDLAHSFNRMATMLAELDQMKADFIAHMSHELRTPLTGIKEGTALLLEEIPGALTAAQRRILEVVRTHSARLFHSVAALLDLSKMEAGMLEYVRTPSDLGLLIDRSIDAVQLPAQKKGLQVEVAHAAALPLLSLDETRMQEVLENLLSNAVKFTPEQGTIQVATRLDTTGPHSQVEVRVTDTGPGLPAEDVQRIFDKFYQSPYHRQEHRQGTGLGLTIAQHIVEAHGGRIWAESQLGHGTTVAFRVPVDAGPGAVPFQVTTVASA